MLFGYYSVDGGKHRINLEGYDFDSYLTFFGRVSSAKESVFWDRGVVVEEATEGRSEQVEYTSWSDLYIQVNSGDIKLDDLKVNGIKTRFNVNAFSRLGSIIRGMKSICIPQREEDYNSLSIGNDFGSKSFFVYEYFGNKVHLVEGKIQYLEYRNDETGEVLVLEEKYAPPTPIFKSTSTARKISLDLNEFSRVDDLASSSGNSMAEFFSGTADNLDSEDVYSLSEIIEMNPDKSYVWLKSRKYHIVNDLEVWKKIAKRIWNHDNVVGFDTETTGLNITFKSVTGNGDQLVGLVFSIMPTKKELELLEKNPELKDDILYADSWYIPIAHKKFENIVPSSGVSTFMEKYIKPILEKKMIVCHNGAYDAKVMFIYDIHINLVHDTMIMLRLSYGAEDTLMRLGLKPNVKRFLGRDSFELSDFVKGKFGKDSDITFADLPYESVKYYACPDTDSMLALLQVGIQNNWFDRFGMRRVYQLEVAFTICVAYQEFFGHHVAVEKIEKLRTELERDVDKYSSLIFEIAGYSLNLRSPAQLKKLLFEELGMPILDYTSAGQPSTDKSVLKKYKGYTNEDGTPKYPIADYLLKYRDAAKLQSDFIKNIDEIATPDGFMFSGVKQFLETGRLSVSGPNYQSYNDTVKKYISPRKGFYMMDSDYSSVEIRIMMSMAREKPMIEYLFDPDADYHTLKASQMFSIPYELVSKKQRGSAKGVNFGIVYGMGDASLGENVTGEKSEASTRYGAQLRKLYFKGMDVTESFIKSNLDSAVENRYAETFFGRRRYFPPTMKIGSVKRQGGNHPIQGTAADLYKQAMVNLYANIKKRGWWGKFLLTCFVHDEIVLEAHNSINPAIAMKMVRESLMLDIPEWCPLYIGFGYGSHWYNAKKTEMPVQLQQELTDQFGDSGYPFWNGNIDDLYAWEVRQIFDYKARRIREYLLDEENHNKVISPVISGFLYEVVPYVLQLDKMYKAINKLKSFLEEGTYSEKGVGFSDDVQDLVVAVRNVEKSGVHLDSFTSKFALLLDKAEISLDSITTEDYYVMFEGAKEMVESISDFTFVSNLVRTDVEMGGITKTLEAYGNAFGLSDLVSTANLLEPDSQEVEATNATVEEEQEDLSFLEDLEEVDKEEQRNSYIDSFGYYRDYDESTVYLSGKNKALLDYMLNYVLMNGGITKQNPDLYKEARDVHNASLENGSPSKYTRLQFVLPDNSLHKTVLYIDSAKASYLCTMVTKAKLTMGI